VAVEREADGGEHAYSNTEESQTTDTFAPATVNLENDREGSEQEIQRTVDDCDIWE